MTTETVSQAVTVRQKEDKVVAWLRDNQDDIAMAAATHIKPSAVIRVTQGALRRDPKLMHAAITNPMSLLAALLDCARLGHEPDTDDYYLVPFGNEVTGIEGYKGIIERMYRAGAVTSVVAQVVRQRDRYRSRGENTPPVHEFDDFASPDERGPVKGAYAYAIMRGGQCSQVVRMGKAELDKHKATSRGSNRPESPWQGWEEQMVKKTVLRALEPYVPTSTEYRTSPAVSGGRVYVDDGTQGINMPRPHPAAHAVPPAGDVVNGEVIPDPEPASASARPGKTVQAVTDLVQRMDLGYGSADDDVAALDWLAGAPWQATPAQARTVYGKLEKFVNDAGGDLEKARDAIWHAYRNDHPEPESNQAQEDA